MKTAVAFLMFASSRRCSVYRLIVMPALTCAMETLLKMLLLSVLVYSESDFDTNFTFLMRMTSSKGTVTTEMSATDASAIAVIENERLPRTASKFPMCRLVCMCDLYCCRKVGGFHSHWLHWRFLWSTEPCFFSLNVSYSCNYRRKAIDIGDTSSVRAIGCRCLDGIRVASKCCKALRLRCHYVTKIF